MRIHRLLAVQGWRGESIRWWKRGTPLSSYQGIFPSSSFSSSSCIHGLPISSPSFSYTTSDYHGTTRGKKSSMHFGVNQIRGLDLSLNLDKTDFASMAAATKEAIQKERQSMGVGLKMSNVIPREVIEKDREELVGGPPLSGIQQQEGSAGTSGKATPATQTIRTSSLQDKRMIRGVVHAGAVHDSRDPRVAYRQLREENHELRFTLKDALEECAVSNNWAKAFGIFDQAVQKSIEAVPLTLLVSCPDVKESEGSKEPKHPSKRGSEEGGEEEIMMTPSSSHFHEIDSTSSSSHEKHRLPASTSRKREDMAFAMLYNINATSPPPCASSHSPTAALGKMGEGVERGSKDSSSSSPLSSSCFSSLIPAKGFASSGDSIVNVSLPSGRMMAGVIRWKAFHYCTLLSLLMKCHRWKEVDRVWEVLRKIGFISFQMDERMVNRLIPVIRRAVCSPRTSLNRTGENSIAGRRVGRHEEEGDVGEEGEMDVDCFFWGGESPLWCGASLEDEAREGRGIRGGEVDGDNDDGVYGRSAYGDYSRSALHLELDMTAKATARRMLLDIEWISKKKGFYLHKANGMVIRQARIAEAMKQAQEAPEEWITDEEKSRIENRRRGTGGGKAEESTTLLSTRKESGVHGGCAEEAKPYHPHDQGILEEDCLNGEIPPSLPPVRVDAGDFNGLLRRASSYRTTQHILNVMEQLSIKKTAETFANIIASLQNPLYLVEGASEDELQSNYGTDGTFQRVAAAVHHRDAPRAMGEKTTEGNHIREVEPPLPPLSPVDIEIAKEKYGRYKAKRIQVARCWLDQCPIPIRNAMLYNEYLYLVRGKECVKEYARVLKQFRGNALFADESLLENRALVTERKANALPSSSPGGTIGGGNPASILPPQWKTPPDAKTYEALFFRLRYLHQWNAMWELLEEMRSEGLYGTPRTYEMLIMEAKTHPPSQSNNIASLSSFPQASR